MDCPGCGSHYMQRCPDWCTGKPSAEPKAETTARVEPRYRELRNKRLEAVADTARSLEGAILKEPLLHGDSAHQAWLTAEIRRVLAPLNVTLAELDAPPAELDAPPAPHCKGALIEYKGARYVILDVLRGRDEATGEWRPFYVYECVVGAHAGERFTRAAAVIDAKYKAVR